MVTPQDFVDKLIGSQRVKIFQEQVLRTLAVQERPRKKKIPVLFG